MGLDRAAARGTRPVVLATSPARVAANSWLTDRMAYMLVSGPPASGKSTLAVPLARRLDWPLLSKDTVKETLGDALGVADERWSEGLSRAAFEVLFAVAAEVPRAVLEGNFYPEARTSLAALSGPLVELHCRCPLTECRRRFQNRPRHPIHGEHTPPLSFFSQFEQPVGLGPVLEVDTTTEVDLDEVLAWLAARIPHGTGGLPHQR